MYDVLSLLGVRRIRGEALRAEDSEGKSVNDGLPIDTYKVRDLTAAPHDYYTLFLSRLSLGTLWFVTVISMFTADLMGHIRRFRYRFRYIEYIELPTARIISIPRHI